MKKNENGFSMIIVVIFMSIAALFIGYLMGSWLISFLVEDNSQEIAKNQNTPEVNQQLEKEKVKEQELNNSQNNLTAPEKEENNKVEKKSTPKPETKTTIPKKEKETPKAVKNSSTEQKEVEKKSPFAVQIGAFSNYQNALSVKNKVEKMGFKVIVSDSTPHQVQVTGYPSREKAEAVLTELKSEGYNGFIVVRE